jgi:hypothetical protein
MILLLLPHGLARLPEKLGRVAQQVAARGKDWIVTHPIGGRPRHDVEEIALIRDTINHYGPVFIASLSIQIRRAGFQKKFGVGLNGARRLARADEVVE